jgi:hypothetical protein
MGQWYFEGSLLFGGAALAILIATGRQRLCSVLSAGSCGVRMASAAVVCP